MINKPVNIDMDTPRRPLYANERMAWAMDRIYPFNIQAKIGVKGKITLELLKKALSKLQSYHPYLQAGITDEPNDPHIVFGIAQSMPVWEVEVRNKKESKDIALRELHMQIPLYPGPLIRVVLLTYASKNKSEILFTINHAICDGICGVHVIHELLTLVNESLTGKNLPAKEYDEFTPFEERVARIKASPNAADNAYSSEEKANYKHLKNTPNSDSKVDDIKRSTYQINKIINEAETEKIILACKQAQIKMDALMGAITMLAMQKKINQDNTQQVQSLILCKTLVNMRRFLDKEVPKQQLGYYVSCIATLQRVGANDDLMVFAKKIHGINEHNFDLDIPLLNIMNINCLMFPFFSKEEMLRQSACHFSTVTVSNLGLLDFSNDSAGIQLKGMDCAMTSHVFPLNENVFTLILFTLHGKLNLNFQFAKPYVTMKAANTLIANTLNLLKMITSAG